MKLEKRLENEVQNWRLDDGKLTGRIVAHLCVPLEDFSGLDEEDLADTVRGTLREHKRTLMMDLGPMLLGAIANQGPQRVEFKVTKEEKQKDEDYPFQMTAAFVRRLEIEFMSAPGEGQEKEIRKLKAANERAGNALQEIRTEMADKYWTYQLNVEDLQRRLAMPAPERSTVEEF